MNDFSRRSVLRASAWTVPAIALAVAAPAAAASDPTIRVTATVSCAAFPIVGLQLTVTPAAPVPAGAMLIFVQRFSNSGTALSVAGIGVPPGWTFVSTDPTTLAQLYSYTPALSAAATPFTITGIPVPAANGIEFIGFGLRGAQIDSNSDPFVTLTRSGSDVTCAVT